MTHYDPNDWDDEPDGGTPTPRWVWWVGIPLWCALVAGLLTQCGEAKAQDTAIFADGFELTEEPGAPPCTDQPAALVPWQRAWSSPNGRIQAVYPSSIGVPVPIGASKTLPTAIVWTPQGGEIVDVYWDTAQSNPGLGYPRPRPAVEMELAFSACAGWFDVPPGCSVSAGSASLLWHSVIGLAAGCYLPAGVPAYLNIRVVECSDAPNSREGCDVNATHRPL